MIIVHKLQLNPNADAVYLDIETGRGYEFTKIEAWYYEDFEKPDKAKVMTLSNRGTNRERFKLSSKKFFKVDKVVGLWVFRFTSNQPVELDDEGNPLSGVGYVPNSNFQSQVLVSYVANLTPQNECILRKLLKLKIDKCKVVIEDDCQECVGNPFYLTTLLSMIKYTLKTGYNDEAIKMLKDFDAMCEVCHTCPDLGDTMLVNGSGVGMLEQVFTEEVVAECNGSECDDYKEIDDKVDCQTCP